MEIDQSGEEQPADDQLCSACIGESFLQAQVEAQGQDGECAYCGEEGTTLSISQIADWIEAAFEEHYYKTPTNPDTEDSLYMESGHDWYRKGYPVLEVIKDLAEIDEAPAKDILEVLADRHFDVESARMGEECEFDQNSYYSDKGVNTAELDAAWEYFESDLQRNARYFSRVGTSTLSSIFQGIGELRTAEGRPVIVEAGPGMEISALFRARVFQAHEKLEQAIQHPDTELGPPPVRLAVAGRMNAFGISVFYGAVTPETAIAEVRPPVGSKVLVGRFELTRALRLIDVEALRAVYIKGSLFDPAFSRNLERAKFLEGLSRRMTKPVMPEDEPLQHLATQAIADFLSSDADPSVDGIIYPSVQTSSGRPNVVLFHKAARVERLEIPEGTEIHSRCSSLNDEDEAEDESIEYWVWEAVPVEEPAKDSQPETWPRFDPRFLLNTADFDDRPPSLRLDVSSLEVRHIREVTFKTDTYEVHRHRIEKRPPPTAPALPLSDIEI